MDKSIDKVSNNDQVHLWALGKKVADIMPILDTISWAEIRASKAHREEFLSQLDSHLEMEDPNQGPFPDKS